MSRSDMRHCLIVGLKFNFNFSSIFKQLPSPPHTFSAFDLFSDGLEAVTERVFGHQLHLEDCR